MSEDLNFKGLVPDEPPAAAAPTPIAGATPPAPAQIVDGYNLSGLTPEDQNAFNDAKLKERYGTVPQQILAGFEGAAQGIAGPLAPAAEIATGLTSGKDILGRAHVNPFTHGLSEAGAFGAAAVFGDELGLPGIVGEIGEGAAKLAPKMAGAVGAFRGAAEMATIAASNEFSKMVEGDPNQTLGTAAVSVGLSGLLGGLGGGLLEKINPLESYAKSQRRAKATGVIEKILGGAGALGAGTLIGGAVGHPLLGAMAGYAAERTLEPVFSFLAKPLASKIANMGAAEAAYDYLYASHAGDRVVQKTVTALFTKAAESIQLHDMLPPSDKEREKLQSYLLKNDDIQQAMNMGNPIAHYMPEHSSAAAQLTATAINYFNEIKPKQPTAAPFDSIPPVNKAAEYRYNRALDIAQKPMLAIKHIENGTLLPQDVKTIQTLYPGLHNGIVKSITDNMIRHPEAFKNFPYAKKQAMNMFIGGNALHGSMSQPMMQSILMGNAGAQQQTQGGGKASPANGSTLNQMNKISSMYQTPLERRQIQKGK